MLSESEAYTLAGMLENDFSEVHICRSLVSDGLYYLFVPIQGSYRKIETTVAFSELIRRVDAARTAA